MIFYIKIIFLWTNSGNLDGIYNVKNGCQWILPHTQNNPNLAQDWAWIWKLKA